MTAYDWGFRLSKRDRGEVDRMAREIARLEAALAAAHGEVGDSDTFADPNSEYPRPLGTGVPVRFGGADTLGDTFDVELVNGELRILVNGLTSDTAIVPQSNNTIRVVKIPRRQRG